MTFSDEVITCSLSLSVILVLSCRYFLCWEEEKEKEDEEEEEEEEEEDSHTHNKHISFISHLLPPTHTLIHPSINKRRGGREEVRKGERENRRT